MIWASPRVSAATRAKLSGMGRQITFLILGAPRQYAGLASSTTRSSLTHSTNLYGPVPTGFVPKASQSTCFRYWGGSICPRSPRSA